MREVLLPTRELIDGKWHRVDVSRDGRVQVDFGEDDQLPDADGVNFFVPINLRCTENPLKRPAYCGKCRRMMNGEYDGKRREWRHCPRCGAGIAHRDWTDGEVLWTAPWELFDKLPDVLPDFSENFSTSSRAMLSSGAIAIGRESSGNKLLTGESPSDAIAGTTSAKAGQ